MTKRFILILCLISIAVSSFASDSLVKRTVCAYYFHSNFRCATCYKIEQYSKEAIENNFKDELASGKLVFKTINIEEKGNEHFVHDYQLFTKSLVLSLVQDGKEVRFKNLTKVWELIGNKQNFFDYVKAEIEDYLERE